MHNSIMQDLYYGRINPWGRRPNLKDENIRLNRRIEDEKRYFINKLSPDDARRFEALDNLHNQSGAFEQESAFAYGFKLGTLLASAVFLDENGLVHE